MREAHLRLLGMASLAAACVRHPIAGRNFTEDPLWQDLAAARRLALRDDYGGYDELSAVLYQVPDLLTLRGIP